jgi:hypothetical protein
MSAKNLNYICFRTAEDGSFVCAEGGGGHELVANRPAAAQWEVFRTTWVSPGEVALRAYNGQYVCAEGGGGHEVVVNRNAIGAWEVFRWEAVSTAVDWVAQVRLRAANGQYVCAEGGGGGKVVANRDAAAEWETFDVFESPDWIDSEFNGWGH